MGGPGSGRFPAGSGSGHSGRPGVIGGSKSSGKIQDIKSGKKSLGKFTNKQIREVNKGLHSKTKGYTARINPTKSGVRNPGRPGARGG